MGRMVTNMEARPGVSAIPDTDWVMSRRQRGWCVCATPSMEVASCRLRDHSLKTITAFMDAMRDDGLVSFFFCTSKSNIRPFFFFFFFKLDAVIEETNLSR